VSVGGERLEKTTDLRVGQHASLVGLGDHADEVMPVDEGQTACAVSKVSQSVGQTASGITMNIITVSRSSRGR
jgi:hypothetical protein